MDFWSVLGYLLAIAGILATILAYFLGKAGGRRETERSARLNALTLLRREIVDARQYFNDWFAPITVGSGAMSDPNFAQEAGKKIDAIKVTFSAVREHLKEGQRDATEELIREFGSNYLQFAYACRHKYPDKQKEIAEAMQEWFAVDLQVTLNEVLTESEPERRS